MKYDTNIQDTIIRIAGKAALQGQDKNSEILRMARTLNYLFLQINIATNGAKEDGATNVEQYLLEIKESAENILMEK